MYELNKGRNVCVHAWMDGRTDDVCMFMYVS